MPRLQILQHKSYHPYLEKNKQRVREDEARAAADELAREQKRVDTEAEARLDILRRRAGSPSFPTEEDNLPSTSSASDEGSKAMSLLERHRKEKAREEKRERKAKARLDFDFPTDSARRRGKEKDVEERQDEGEGDDRDRGRWEMGGHVNLFADLERDAKPQPTLAEIAKKKKDQESDPFTMYLGRPERETKPWYADRELKRVEEKEIGDEAEERRAREKRKDARSKSRNDPLTQITSMLSSSSSKSIKSRPHPRPHAQQTTNQRTDPSSARQAREMSERERALALIAKSKAPQRSWDTPSSVGGAGESWADDWERQKNVASHRFFGTPSGGPERPGGFGGFGRSGGAGGRRSWEV